MAQNDLDLALKRIKTALAYVRYTMTYLVRHLATDAKGVAPLIQRLSRQHEELLLIKGQLQEMQEDEPIP